MRRIWRRLGHGAQHRRASSRTAETASRWRDTDGGRLSESALQQVRAHHGARSPCAFDAVTAAPRWLSRATLQKAAAGPRPARPGHSARMFRRVGATPGESPGPSGRRNSGLDGRARLVGRRAPASSRAARKRTRPPVARRGHPWLESESESGPPWTPSESPSNAASIRARGRHDRGPPAGVGPSVDPCRRQGRRSWLRGPALGRTLTGGPR